MAIWHERWNESCGTNTGIAPEPNKNQMPMNIQAYQMLEQALQAVLAQGESAQLAALCYQLGDELSKALVLETIFEPLSVQQFPIMLTKLVDELLIELCQTTSTTKPCSNDKKVTRTLIFSGSPNYVRHMMAIHCQQGKQKNSTNKQDLKQKQQLKVALAQSLNNMICQALYSFNDAQQCSVRELAEHIMKLPEDNNQAKGNATFDYNLIKHRLVNALNEIAASKVSCNQHQANLCGSFDNKGIQTISKIFALLSLLHNTLLQGEKQTTQQHPEHNEELSVFGTLMIILLNPMLREQNISLVKAAMQKVYPQLLQPSTQLVKNEPPCSDSSDELFDEMFDDFYD